ncbi:MAG: XdhC family protein, partial [Cloacibacillus porcorum]|nr:XdhC family protein [Cloacibacillus porcorum]
VVIMTRGHALDAEAVTVTDKKPGAYYGMIGSRSKISTVRKMLLERGVSEEHLDRIYQPIGLPIKAETPNEIAVSVMAEIIAVKYGADIKRLRG